MNSSLEGNSIRQGDITFESIDFLWKAHNDNFERVHFDPLKVHITFYQSKKLKIDHILDKSIEHFNVADSCPRTPTFTNRFNPGKFTSSDAKNTTKNRQNISPNDRLS
jgi:hypothetical protein